MVSERTFKKPRKVTAKSLERVAVHYLDRFDTTAANLHRVLMNRVRRSAQFHETDIEEGEGLVAALVERFVGVGIVDDARYATTRSQSLFRRGSSLRAIEFKLREKGVKPPEIEAALEALRDETENPDFVAAAALVRRRRLGPYRKSEVREMSRDKDLAALARAGFSYSVAQRVIGAETIDELADMLAEDEAIGRFGA